MVAQGKPRLGELGSARLPDPTAHAGRAREATATLVLPASAELLYVASLGGVPLGSLAVLRRADGTVLDEEVAVCAGARLQVGDRVVRLPLPGRGRRDAAGSFVALGPVNPVRGAPTVQVGPTFGPAAGSGATASVAGSDDYCRVTVNTGGGTGTGVLFTLTWSVPRPNANYGVVVSGRNAAARGVVAGGIAQSGADTVQCPVGIGAAPPASTQLLFNVVTVPG